MKRINIASVVLMAATVSSTTANAALLNNSILAFDASVVTTSSSGANIVTSGSYIVMDADGDGFLTERERIAISMNDGLIVGTVQDYSVSSNSRIDNAWAFFEFVGLHYSQAPTNILSDNGAGDVTLDFSGW